MEQDRVAAETCLREPHRCKRVWPFAILPQPERVGGALKIRAQAALSLVKIWGGECERVSAVVDGREAVRDPFVNDLLAFNQAAVRAPPPVPNSDINYLYTRSGEAEALSPDKGRA